MSVYSANAYMRLNVYKFVDVGIAIVLVIDFTDCYSS